MAMTAQQSLEQEAAEWAVAMDRGLTPAEETSLERWLAASPQRQGALVRARAVWRAATGCGGQAERSVPTERPVRGWTRRGGLLAGGLAAGIAATVGVAVLWGREGDYRTGDLEVRRLAMADGSEAVLNARTRLTVKFSDERRHVALRSGEAWFDVARDPARPFVVATPEVRITAVGTAFSVRETAGATEVMVSEGTVRVETRGGASRLVSAGGRMRLGQAAPVESRLDAGRIQRRLAWRDGLIMLDGETLAEAAAEFNQYSERKIRVSPDIAGKKVVGVFRISDVEGFARANGQLLSVKVDLDADEIRIGELGASQKIRNK